MHIVVSKFTSATGKVYEKILLRESYREGNKVKKRTIANFSSCSPEEIAAIKLALKHKGNLSQLTSSDTPLSSGKSIGSVWVIAKIAEQLGITRALGTNWQGVLALWQVITRVIDQGSRLSSIRFGETFALASTINLQRGFDENDLYQNLHWIADHQEKIEDALFKQRKNPPSLFLYDVTSSYLEGQHNDLANWGYNRDGKKGKKQIVIGLLCDNEGVPVSMQVFRGNTQDTKTFSDQVRKVKDRFHCKKVTLVGDRGMIKTSQIDDLLREEFSYITAITKPQIETLLKRDVLQYDLFDEALCEVVDDGIRYILRKNPERARECRENRTEKQAKIEAYICELNTYLEEHPRAKPSKALARAKAKIKQLAIDSWLSVKLIEKKLTAISDEESRKEAEQLDGCYAIKTNLLEEDMVKVHARYKDLALVERAFRTCKSDIEIRPVFVRSEKSTYGHVFVVMLAYMIIKTLDHAWEKLCLTTREGLESLSSISLIQIPTSSGFCEKVPLPTGQNKKMLEALNIVLPAVLPKNQARVVTRKKRRKTASTH